MIRAAPLEIQTLSVSDEKIRVPTEAEILRIKGVLILKRNATRDYLDFVALANRISADDVTTAFTPFDTLYPQENGESPLQQLQIQLGDSLPDDLEEAALAEYKSLKAPWSDWATAKRVCARIAVMIFDRVCERKGNCPT